MTTRAKAEARKAAAIERDRHSGTTQRRKPSRPAAAPARPGGRRRLLTCHGRTVNLFELAAEYGLSPKTLRTRLDRNGMTPEQAVAAPVKKQAGPAGVAERQAAIYKFCEDQQPVTARGVYYYMETNFPHFVAKTENGYKMVQSDLVKMRKRGDLPYEWIVDNTRRAIRPFGYHSVAAALDELIDTYRKLIWDEMDCVVQVWIEKDALAGVVEQVTLHYGVALMVARGYSSLSFLHKEAQALIGETRPIYIFHLGDYDAEGRDAARAIEETLREMAPDANIIFKCLAVKDEAQIRKLKLPTRPAKTTSSRAEAWGGKPCVELDAIAPDVLRKMVKSAINKCGMTEERLQELEEPDPDLEPVRRLAKKLKA